ncbi:hypothetical protein [Rhizobium mongolense]|uniref:Uncharacterized protein n=1 Tax=Rhizobium mongolense TaxID=57676 RepID=A0ABR6IMN5_9HYPH|nr:hypothetical protein [Rhizobium mongolense]MBB4229151.1 hypothetical protein [Rhizobium mongolense]
MTHASMIGMSSPRAMASEHFLEGTGDAEAGDGTTNLHLDDVGYQRPGRRITSVSPSLSNSPSRRAPLRQ